MAQLKELFKKIILIIIAISILITFCAMPASYAKLDLGEDEFYYAGTQKGQYTVSDGVFDWLLSKIGDIADWILGIITLGFRMIFVGWTALIEKMLTWALESTAGVNVSGDVVESSTDLTSITDSSNNVTIEAIVYNHVPALNANVFDIEEKFEDLKYSGTGQILRCRKCSENPEDDVTKCCSPEDGTCSCECQGNCAGCRAYAEAVKKFNNKDENAKDPIIIQIKKSVAMWYYIIRMLAIAGMLIVLVVVGIKMAISTVASDKAVYKRMLIDWFVGMIILFSMHYIMLTAIYIEENLVSVIENTAHSINNVQMKQLADKNSEEGVEYTNSQIEVKVYEEVRTRAYDAKLINGLTGMIMYMTLVYFAFRYTVVYIKRLFTIIVLTIMAPAVGFAYAMQKTMSGNQQVVKSFFPEYVLNLGIQIIHAIIYGIFIAPVLVLSLESIPGLIMALVLMNYALKADALFRRVFKVSTGGLVDDTNNSLEQLKSSVTEAVTGGKSAVQTLTQTPYMNTVKGVGKLAVSAPFVAASGIRKGVSAKVKQNSASSGTTPFVRSSNSEDALSNPNSEEASSRATSSTGNTGSTEKPRATSLPTRTDNQLLSLGKNTIKENLDTAKEGLINAKTSEEQKVAMDNLLIATDEYNRYESLTKPSSKDIALGHLDNLFDIDNHYVLNKKSGAFGILKSLYYGTLGNTYIDHETGKKVNDGTGYYKQLTPTKLLGLTEEDKKIMWDEIKRPLGTIGGFFSLLAGMSTMVAHPMPGGAAAIKGYSMVRNGLKKPTTISRYKGKYINSKYGIPYVKNMKNEMLDKAQKEYDDLMIKEVKSKHPKLYKALALGTATAVTLGVGLTGGTALVPAALFGAGFATRSFTNSRNIGEGLEDVRYHFDLQQKKQEKEFKKEILNVLKVEDQAKMEYLLSYEDKQEDETRLKQLYDQLGYIYDPVTGKMTKKGNTSDEFKEKEEFENRLDSKMKNNTVEDYIIEDSVDRDRLTETDIKYIDKEIDNILIKMSAGKVLDVNSEKTLDLAMSELTSRLVTAGIITNDQRAEEVFRSGKNGLKKALKQKAALANTKIEVAEKALDGIDEDDKKLIKELIENITKQENISDFTTINVEDIIEKLGVLKNTNGNETGTVILSQIQKRKFNIKITKYLQGLEIAKKVTHDSAYDKKRKVKKQVNKSSTSNKRKKKLQQILEMTFDTEIDDPTNDIIDQVNLIKNTGGIVSDNKGNAVEISSDESNRVLELLFLRKELEEINNIAIEEIELTKGPYNFTKAKKAKSEATIDYYSDKLKVEKYIQEHSDIYNDKDYKKETTRYTEEQIEERKQIEDLEKGLENKKTIMEKAEREVIMNGPIVDLNDTKKQLLSDE